MPGVVSAAARADAVEVEFERTTVTAQELVDVIAAGSAPTPPPLPSGTLGDGHDGQSAQDSAHQHDHGGIFGERSELIFAGLAGTLLFVGWLMATFADTPRPAELVIYSLAFFFGAFFTVQEAFASVRQGRFEIDFLMLVSAAGAAALGEVPEGALLLFLFSVGHALEGYAMGGRAAGRLRRSQKLLRRRHLCDAAARARPSRYPLQTSASGTSSSYAPPTRDSPRTASSSQGPAASTRLL